MLKPQRQARIIELIRQNHFATQEEILDALLSEGFKVTQATVSRDLRELNLIKKSNGNSYCYVLHEDVSAEKPPVFSHALVSSVRKINFAGNLIVVKTYPGMAQAVATCIDTIESGEIIGCVAGDDAILVVVANESIAANVTAKLKKFFSDRTEY